MLAQTPGYVNTLSQLYLQLLFGTRFNIREIKTCRQNVSLIELYKFLFCFWFIFTLPEISCLAIKYLCSYKKSAAAHKCGKGRDNRYFA